MPICCVYKCSKREGHCFPKDPKLKKMWLHAVRWKNWTPTKTSVVCSAHFLASDYIIESKVGGYTLVRKRLMPNVVPTIFQYIQGDGGNSKKTDVCAARTKRMEQRRQLRNEVDQDQEIDTENNADDMLDSLVVGTLDIAEEIVITEGQIASTGGEPTVSKLGVDFACQTATDEPRFSMTSLLDNHKAIHFYTGLENYSKFSLVLETLGPAAYRLNYHNSQVLHLSVENQFFLTLIKLRLNKQLFELSLMFEISECTVSNIFNTWVPFMALQWGEMDIWPSQELVKYYMPQDFQKKFPQTRVIMDGTEFPIGKPKEPNAQQVTFSTYKNRNTLKVLVGVTPAGLISYSSEAYGGSASDRQIVERSNFVNMCSRGDNIMADRGFNVQDIFAPKDVHINIPSFLKGKSQLPGLTVVHDRKIASKRVHVERIIGMTKTYKILKHELNTNFVCLGSEIYFVCAMLCNFRIGIVGLEA